MGTDYTLSYGTHSTPDEGRCAMEWVSYLAGEPHSDDPACVSPVLRAYCTSLTTLLTMGLASFCVHASRARSAPQMMASTKHGRGWRLTG